MTERALLRSPGRVLAAVSEARRRGWAIALDDLGADRASLAVMPFLAPDLLKLDLRLVQGRPTTEGR